MWKFSTPGLENPTRAVGDMGRLVRRAESGALHEGQRTFGYAFKGR